jgi:uncharacterized membrane protein
VKTPFSVAVGFLISFTCSTAFAQSTPYTFVTIDITVPDRPGQVAFPEDISDAGEIVTSILSPAYGIEAVIAEPLKRKRPTFTTTLFQCAVAPFADTEAVAINRSGKVTGTCVTEPNGSTVHGFVRDRSGNHTLLDYPGADHTLPLGISSQGQVVGVYYSPLEPGRSGLFRIHGFKWSDGSFETIDFPVANAYTLLKSINERGRIVGEYYRFDPTTNETLEHNWFVYQDGQFSLEFPPSLEWNGGPALFLADINDSGQVLVMRHNSGPDWNGIFVVEDGAWDRVTFPPDFAYMDVRGMNNKGQFVGMYLKQVGIDPYYGWPLYESHGYIATPESQAKPTSTSGVTGGKDH